MLEHIGVITCVETVAVAEHGGAESGRNRILASLVTVIKKATPL